MLEWTISSSVLIAVVIALRFALKGKISLRLQYALWALVLVRLLIPFSFASSSLSVMNSVEQSSVYQTTSKVVTTVQVPSDIIRDSELTIEEAEQVGHGTLHRVEGYPVESGRENLHTYSFQDSLKEVGSRVLRIVWIFGMCIMGLWFAATNLILSIKLRRNRTVHSYENCPLPVYTSDAVDTPCLFGLFRPAVYLTSEAASDEATTRHAVEHELTHYIHKDHIWAILRGVCLAVHWYNPLVWCAAILSRNDAELACDEATIRRLGESERAAYGRTLIGLTCEKRTALLNTATTMTGSGKSIKERIALIAKKPKMAVYTLVAVILIAAIAVGCTFTGAKEGPHSFTEWTESLTAEDIQLAEVSKAYGVEKMSYVLTVNEYQSLCSMLNGITEDDCSVLKPKGSNEDGYRMALYRADKLWLFKCLSDGTIGLMFNDAETGAYFGCEGSLLIIDCPDLWSFIVDIVDKKGTASVTIDVTEDVANTVPKAVIEYALDYVQQQIDYYNELGGNPSEGNGNYTITAAKIIGLEQANTGATVPSDGVALYRLEYRLLADHPENIIMAGGMSVESGWLTEHGSTGQPHLLLRYEEIDGEKNWTRICVTNTDVIEVEYGTPEMLEKYGDPYTAAAMELYQKSLQGFNAFTRLTTLRPEDIKHTAGFCDVDVSELASLLSAAAANRIEYTGSVRAFWTLEVYLSGGPHNFNTGTAEWFSIQTGPEENIVEILYHSEDGEYSTLYFEDNALYWFVRETYTTEEIIDEDAFARFGEILSFRAQARVDGSKLNEMYVKPYTGYEIIRLVRVDEFTQGGAKYEIYEWAVAFFHDNPISVLAGGMWVDSELRVRDLEQETYFVTRTSGDLVDYEFFFWDLYFGPDEDSGRENAHATITEVFGAYLDMQTWCTNLAQEWQRRFNRNEEPLSILRVDGNRERALAVDANMISVLSSAANNLQLLDQVDGFRALGGGIYVWFDSTRHLAFFAGEELFKVKVRYVADDANEAAVVYNPQLYLYLVASAEKENVELVQLDEDGELEAILWLHSESNLIIYDIYENEILRIDTNKTISCAASSYTGLIANIKPEYSRMIQAQSEDGTVSIYQYHRDGTFTYVCPLSEVLNSVN